VNDSGQIVGEYAFDNGLQADGFLLTPEPNINFDGLLFVGDPLPTPPPLTALFGPIDLGLVDVLPLKEFRASSVPEPSTWAMMVLAFAGFGVARLSRSRRGAGERVNAASCGQSDASVGSPEAKQVVTRWFNYLRSASWKGVDRPV